MLADLLKNLLLQVVVVGVAEEGGAAVVLGARRAAFARPGRLTSLARGCVLIEAHRLFNDGGAGALAVVGRADPVAALLGDPMVVRLVVSRRDEAVISVPLR